MIESILRYLQKGRGTEVGGLPLFSNFHEANWVLALRLQMAHCSRGLMIRPNNRMLSAGVIEIDISYMYIDIRARNWV